jgi:hypothetical protein
MKRTLTGVLAAAALSACAVGMHVRDFEPARSAEGVRATVRTPTTMLTGELLEVRDTGLLLLTTGDAVPSDGAPQQNNRHPVRLIPYSAIARAQFAQLGSGGDLENGRPPSHRLRERLRLVSRFPYGMSPAVEADLLKAHGQSAVAEVER